MKFSNIEKMSKQELLDTFVEVCSKGTSRDCRIFVAEAEHTGLVTYEELCQYKQRERKK